MNLVSEIFENCKVQYAYNQRQRVYSVRITLDGRPRIITMRVGDNFTEMSLANLEGEVLEIIKEEEGKGITVNKQG